MYLPKSKYQTNLYASPDQFVYADDNTPYEGPYFKTYKGELYSGIKPSDSSRLIKFVSDEPLDEKETSENMPYTVYDYVRNNPKEVSLKVTQPVVRYYPSLTQQNLRQGYLFRYFVKEKATQEIIEVNAETYTSIVSKDTKYFYPAYDTVALKWYIQTNEQTIQSGYTLPSAVERNKATLDIIEPSFTGIKDYFKLS